MKRINFYAITFKDNKRTYISADGSMSYNYKTQKFTYMLNGKVHSLENVLSYKLIGQNEEAIRVHQRLEEEKKVQKIIDKLEAIRDELENDYGQDDIGYLLGKVIEQVEEKVMPKEYLDEH